MFEVRFLNPSKAAAAVLLVFLFAANVYRAATQSITADEALVYNHFIVRTDEALANTAPFHVNLG